MEFNKLLLNDLSQFGPLEMDRSGVELLTSCNLECFVINRTCSIANIVVRRSANSQVN